MPDVLIRGLSDEAIARLDAEAQEQGLSRNEYLRRKLDDAPAQAGRTTVADLVRASEAVADLANPEVMKGAWR